MQCTFYEECSRKTKPTSFFLVENTVDLVSIKGSGLVIYEAWQACNDCLTGSKVNDNL